MKWIVIGLVAAIFAGIIEYTRWEFHECKRVGHSTAWCVLKSFD